MSITRRPWAFGLWVALLGAFPATHVAAQGFDDWEVKRDPFDKQVIAKYKGFLARNPHDASALAKLLELYKRYRTLDLLRSEYQKLSQTQTDGAALIVLARIDKASGDTARASSTAQQAAKLRARDPETWLLVGELAKASNAAEAQAAFATALSLTTERTVQKRALRALADLALAANDGEAANRHFQAFLQLEPQNAGLWLEHGDAMVSAQRAALALPSYAKAEKLLTSDPARRVEVISRRGQALDAIGQLDEAVAEYRRAIELAPKGYYLEVELTNRIVDIYRRKDDLAGLLRTYESKWPVAQRGHFAWSTLGKLYEETGAQDQAIAAFAAAARKAPWEIDTQRRLIALLESAGRDAEALAQFEAVVRAAPGEARFALDLADRYWRRGKADKALALGKRIEGRFGGDAGVLSALADLYQRWGKENEAIAAYERLTRLEPDDSGHVIALGEQYYAKGEKHKALETWRRIADGKSPTAWVKLAEVLADHGRTPEALEYLAKAVKVEPQNKEIYRVRARVYEAEKAFAEAAADWEKVLALTGTAAADRGARREARKKFVAVLLRWGTRAASYRERWNAAFRKSPPDLESGHLLVELQSRPPAHPDYLANLRKLQSLVADDQDVLLDLVKALRAQRRYDEAVAMLQKLAALAPSREREVYLQIAEIKAEARQDSEAIAWSQKALAKSPNDPAAYERLGQRYIEMQKLPEAMAAYEKVVALDARNFPAHFVLADLYVRQNVASKASELYRRVLRNATDDEVVNKAARAAIELEELTGTLGELERVLTPLAFVMAHKAIYRYAAVELYGRYVPSLVLRLRSDDDAVAHAAHAELRRLGQNGLRPLLEALRDDRDPAQQRIAIAVLGPLGNQAAAAPLVRFAAAPSHAGTSSPRSPVAELADRELRVAALLAGAELGGTDMAPQLVALATDSEGVLREPATWALARTGSAAFAAALPQLLRDAPDNVLVLACAGAGQAGRTIGGATAVAAAVTAIIANPAASDEARGACAWAAGRMQLVGAESVLAALLTTGGDHGARLAATALARLRGPAAAALLLAHMIAHPMDPATEYTVLSALRPLASTPSGENAPLPLTYTARNGRLDAGTFVRQLPGALHSDVPLLAMYAPHADVLIHAFRQGLQRHRDDQLAALARIRGLAALGGETPAPHAGPTATTTPGGTNRASHADAHKLMNALASLEPDLLQLCQHRDVVLRESALRALGALATSEAAANAMLEGVHDATSSVVLAAISSMGEWLRRGPANTIAPKLASALQVALRDPHWAQRAAAVHATAQAGLLTPENHQQLRNDPSAFVREALAVTAGAGREGDATLSALAHDNVAQVRIAVAVQLARTGRLPAVAKALAADADPRVRAAVLAPATK